MNNFISLVKINFMATMSNSTKRSSKILMPVVFILALLASVFYCISFCNMIKELGTNNYDFLIIFSLIISSIFLMFLFIGCVSNILYTSHDNNILFAMPIKTSTIILSKFVSLILVGYMYQFVFIAPFGIAYYIFSGVSFISLLSLILGFFIFPIIPLFLSTILSFFINLITKKLKYKNIFTIFLLFIFFGLFMVFYYKLDVFSLVSNQSTLNYIPFINWLFLSITQNNFLFLVYNFLLCFGVGTILYFFIKFSYLKMCSSLNYVAPKKSKINFKKHNVFYSLILKESSKYFSSPMYVFNTMFGFILLVVLSVVAVLNISNLEDIIDAFNLSPFTLALVIVCILCALISMCSISGVSISMERKNLETLKCLPLSFEKIVWSKIVFAFLVSVPFVLTSSIILVCTFKLGFWGSLLVVVFPMLWSFSCAMFGLVINLNFPNMNSKNDAMLVKQSLSGFLSTFVPLLFWILCFSLLNFINISLNLYVIIVLALSFIFPVYSSIYLCCFAKKRLYKIEL